MKIGFNAAAVRDMHALLATVQASSPDDLLLAISYTGVRRELNLAADEMLRVGGKVLAITGFTPNALQQRASHCLYTIAEEQATNSASISACHAQGNVNGFAVHCADSAGSGTGTRTYSS